MVRPGKRAAAGTLALALVVAGAVVASCLARSESCDTAEPDEYSLAIPPVTSTGPRPSLHRGDVTVGDGRTEWHLGFFGWVYVIPEGMEVQGGGAGRVVPDPDERPLLAMAEVHDVASGSTLWLNVDTGGEVRRRVCPSPDDVDSLFDQIVASRQRHSDGEPD